MSLRFYIFRDECYYSSHKSFVSFFFDYLRSKLRNGDKSGTDDDHDRKPLCVPLSISLRFFFTSVMNSTIHHASHLFLFLLIFRKPGTSPIVPRFARASGKGQVDPAADPSTQGSSARDQDGLQG